MGLLLALSNIYNICYAVSASPQSLEVAFDAAILASVRHPRKGKILSPMFSNQR
jgi:hypothetical protein